MPRLPFLPEHKLETPGDFPKLKFEMGEKKRILCVEEPVYTYTHTLRAPKIVDGKALLVTEKRKDGSTYETFAKDFIGRPQCLGDLDTIGQNGLDPVNCPVCELAEESDMVNAPERRFAMHVVVYATKPNSFDAQLPFSVSIVIWTFTDTTFNKLTDIATEWAGDGGLQKHDLLLGPCTQKDFQKFEIAVSQKAEWLADDSRKKLTVETFRENKAKGELENFAGRRVEKRWMQDDLNKIKTRWRIANGESPFAPEASADSALLGEQSLSAGFDDLLSESASSSKPVEFGPVSIGDILSEPAVESSQSVQDLFAPSESDPIAPVAASVSDVETSAVEESATVPETSKAEEKPAGEVVSFDDLLSSFN